MLAAALRPLDKACPVSMQIVFDGDPSHDNGPTIRQGCQELYPAELALGIAGSYDDLTD